MENSIKIFFIIGTIIFFAPIIGGILFALLAIIYNNWELFAILGGIYLLFFIVMAIKNNRKS